MQAPRAAGNQRSAFDKAPIVGYRNRFASRKGAMDGSGNTHEGKEAQEIGSEARRPIDQALSH
jgi:hypothetical protein